MTFSLSPRLRRSRQATLRLWSALALALLVAVTGLTALASPAAAETVYEIDGRWAPNTPTEVAKGDVVTGVWRVNVNDDRPAPSNDPVENVNFTITLENGLFKTLPDLCLTDPDLTPVSSLSDDGRTLVCNLGTVVQGTAVVVQAPVVADGVTGDQITATGTIADQTDDLDPIAIRNTFGMDMLWGTPTPTYRHGAEPNSYHFDFEWTLFLDQGSDQGPDTVTYNLNIPVQNGQELFLGQQANFEPFNHPCTRFQQGNSAEGHPYSGGNFPTEQLAPFVDSCELVKTGRNTFRMTLTGIDYSLTQVPTQDSVGNPLPADRTAIASGSIWLRIDNHTETTSASLTASAPTYTSVTDQTDQDDTANNTSSKVIPVPGTWNHHFARPGGGNAWDNTFKAPPGGLVHPLTHDTIATTGVPANTVVADCQILDTRFVDYEYTEIRAWIPGDPAGPPIPDLGTVEWYVGIDPTVTDGSASYNPDAFTGCGGGAGWVTEEPTDKTTVKAVRWRGTAGELAGRAIQLRAVVSVEADAPIGQDIWTWGAMVRNGTWVYPNRGADSPVYTPTPGERYPHTVNGRDILHVVFAVPSIRKTGDRQVVRPGEPATFTLTYAANGAGAIPPTVDDYRIVDTLPAGMEYVAGSADPEPTLSTDPQGRQVLTWVLNEVPTNTPHTLVYQAVADDTVTPGQTLTNTATSSLRGETSRPATAQVTVSSSGYTEISKTADTPFIPNLTGDGDGEGAWTVTLRSFDPLPQEFTDTIDILPYEGDGRGTDYEGDYALVAVEETAGATVYYTTADPASLSDDPEDPTNGAAGDPTGNTVDWTTTFTPDATAVRVIGPQLEPGATQQFTVRIGTDGAAGEDLYVNRAQARTGHTELKMRTSEPMTLANYYSAALKKYVQDRSGEWRDANQVADYPSFQYGDAIRYRIVLTNTGQGTIRNLDITDDQQPELGNFHIDSLAPGESKSHEFEITLGRSTTGSVVNTACATADIPADSQVPPTINCDPAGFEVANYKTVKTADPRPGSTVRPGDTVKYTITVTQVGPAPADAELVDDLSDVLDEATYNRDVRASRGQARFKNGRVSWSGTIPVGAVAKVTYSVTVRDVDGPIHLENVVTSPGCAVIDGETPNCVTEHDGGDTSGLPGTGGPPLEWLGLGVGLVVLGGLFLVAARRRRPGAVVTEELALVDGS